jgi:hypothetical protein
MAARCGPGRFKAAAWTLEEEKLDKEDHKKRRRN